MVLPHGLAALPANRPNGSKLLRPQTRIQRYKNKTVGTTRVESYRVDARATLRMKKKRTAQSAFFDACVLLGLVVFFTGTLLALFAASAPGRTGRTEANPRAVTAPATGVTGGDGADGTNCQYTITSGTDTIVPGATDTGNHCVWCETPISLPFPFVLYDQTFNAVNVSSSGRLDFVCTNDPANYLENLPASATA